MKRIVLPQAGIETLYGARDANLKHIESLFRVTIRTQGDELIVSGDSGDEQRVVKLFEQLRALLDAGTRSSNGDVKTAAQLFVENSDVDLRDYFVKGGPAQGQAPGTKRRVNPKSVNQRSYLDAIEQVRHRVRRRSGGHGQDLPGDGAGGAATCWRRRSAGSSWRARRSRRARSSASCPATCRRRSTRTCGRCTTRSTT